MYVWYTLLWDTLVQYAVDRCGASLYSSIWRHVYLFSLLWLCEKNLEIWKLGLFNTQRQARKLIQGLVQR
jgi:hypothetical protein